MPVNDPCMEQARRRRLILLSLFNMMQTAWLAVILYASQWYWKQPYHTSALSGEDWVNELIFGHPERIRTCLGMRVHVFLALISELRRHGMADSRYVTLKEKVAIFLYTCVTGLSVEHVGERFQRSNDTIAKYFKEVLFAVSSPPFYTTYVCLPHADDPPHPSILNNPKWFPFFENAIGAMDGTHIDCCPSASKRAANRDRKGGVTQNCLSCCTFDMQFQFMQSGWEGSVADATMYHHARHSDLRVPEGKYYLADAGFGVCDSLLVPYRGVRYHLAEWGRAGVRPANKEELFNLRHASDRNVIERIFGVFKKRFRILRTPAKYDMEIQARIPPGLSAVHNFIFQKDSTELQNVPDIPDPMPGAFPVEHDFGVLGTGAPTNAEKERSKARRDQIAQDMCDSYQTLLLQRAEEGLE